MEINHTKQAARIQTSVLKAAEKKALVWMANLQPLWVSSDLLPVIGLVLYLLFGTQKKHLRLISDGNLARLKESVVSSNGDMVSRTLPDGHTDIATLLWMTNRSVPPAGNDVKVFTTFDGMYSALMEDLSRASDHVNFEFFKFEDDPLGRKVGYMGGMNIAERYSTELSRGIWRDTHIRVQGPAVAEMQAAFIVDWQFCSKELLGGERFFPQSGISSRSPSPAFFLPCFSV